MATKIISITTLSLFALISLGISPVYASEVTGSLSSGLSNNNSDSSINGSLSGSVASGSTISGTVSNGNSGSSAGSSGSSSGGGSSNNSSGEVLGASTDNVSTNYPGLPNTGMAKVTLGELFIMLATLLVLSILPVRHLCYRKM